MQKREAAIAKAKEEVRTWLRQYLEVASSSSLEAFRWTDQTTRAVVKREVSRLPLSVLWPSANHTVGSSTAEIWEKYPL